MEGLDRAEQNNHMWVGLQPFACHRYGHPRSCLGANDMVGARMCLLSEGLDG